MDRSYLHIKKENILAVIEALSRERQLSRSELANRCDLSLTTVGKIIDRLLDYGILSQKHLATAERGRTPTVFTFSPSALFTVLYVDEAEAIFSVITPAAHLLQSLRTPLTPDRELSEQLHAFLLRTQKTSADLGDRIISCALLTDHPLLDRAAFRGDIRAILGLSVSCEEDIGKALVRAAEAQGIGQDEQRVAIITDRERHSGWILHHGEVRRGDFASLSRLLAGGKQNGETFAQVLDLLTAFLSPDMLLFCAAQRDEILHERMQAVYAAHFRDRQIRWLTRDIRTFLTEGIAVSLRRQWLEQLLADTGLSLSQTRTEESLLSPSVSCQTTSTPPSLQSDRIASQGR